MMTGFSVPWCN